MNDKSLSIYTRKDLQALTEHRDGETRLGEQVKTIDITDAGTLWASLEPYKKQGVRYVVLGIPEDIGSRANLGRAGADSAWITFLEYFLNSQSNQFVDPAKILILGQIMVDDLMASAAQLDIKKADDVAKLRDLVETLDNRASPIIKEIAELGFEVIVIGGAHNNCYPIIKGVSQALHARKAKITSLSCINCDPHADFRRIEGRHSGNGFTYAERDGFLTNYSVLGLHEAYNNQDMLDRLIRAGFKYRAYEDIFVRTEISFHDAIVEAIHNISHKPTWVGLELDLDSIRDMPTSAESPCGISVEDASMFIHYAALQCDIAYLHLPEGAPRLSIDGSRAVGKALTQLVRTYVSARERRCSV